METRKAPDPKAMKDRLSRARDEVAGSLAALAGEVQEITDVRGWVQREPLLFAGAMAVTGFLLAQKPKALSALLSRLVPAMAMAVFKPGLERFAKQLGHRLAERAA